MRRRSRRGVEVVCGLGGGFAALADEASAFFFGAASPDAFFFAGGERVFEAWFAHGADGADGFRCFGGVVGDRVEEVGVCSQASGELAPLLRNRWCLSELLGHRSCLLLPLGWVSEHGYNAQCFDRYSGHPKGESRDFLWLVLGATGTPVGFPG